MSRLKKIRTEIIIGLLIYVLLTAGIMPIYLGDKNMTIFGIWYVLISLIGYIATRKLSSFLIAELEE